jgi:hypothetical protein
MIKHTNEENLNHWKKMLQRQRELFSRADTPGRGRSGTASTQFAWMAAAGPEDPSHGQSNAEISDVLRVGMARALACDPVLTLMKVCLNLNRMDTCPAKHLVLDFLLCTCPRLL